MLSVVLMVGYSCSLCGSTVGCQNHSVSYGKSMLVVSRDKHATCTISIHVCRMMARIICSISVHEHNGRLTICWQSARDANPQSTALVAIDMRTDIRHAVAARQNSHTKASFMHKYEVAIHSLSVCNANEIHISITHLYIYKFNPIYFVSLFSWSRSCHRIFSLAFTYVQFAIIMNALLECAQVMKIQYRNAVWLCLPFCTWLCVYYAALARSLACLVEGDTTHGPNLLFICICYNYANTKHIVCVCVLCNVALIDLIEFLHMHRENAYSAVHRDRRTFNGFCVEGRRCKRGWHQLPLIASAHTYVATPCISSGAPIPYHFALLHELSIFTLWKIAIFQFAQWINY